MWSLVGQQDEAKKSLNITYYVENDIFKAAILSGLPCFRRQKVSNSPCIRYDTQAIIEVEVEVEVTQETR